MASSPTANRAKVETPSRPTSGIALKAPAAAPVCQRAQRVNQNNLREAVLLLAKKVEALGLDMSEITAMLGVSETDNWPPVHPSIPPRKP